MKVLHLTSGEDRYGGKTSILNILRYFPDSSKAALGVLAEGELTEAAKQEGIHVVPFYQKKRLDLTVLFKIRRYIIDNDIEVVHCHGPRANLIGRFLKFFTGQKIIAGIHSDYAKDDYLGHPMLTRFFRWMNHYALKRLDAYICVSEDMKTTLIERGFPLNDIHVVHNGLPIEKAEKKNREELFKEKGLPYRTGVCYMGMLSRLEPVKDHLTLIKAMKSIVEEHADIELLIGGDGSQEKKLKEVVQAWGLESKVHFLGHVHEPDDFFQMIDVNLLTSLSEALGYVLLEGGLWSIPAIASNVGGIREVITHGKEGLLFTVGNEEELAAHMVWMKENLHRQDYGQALERKVHESFAAEKMGGRYLKAYQHILAEKKRIFIIGYYGRFNLGDEAILDVTVSKLKEVFPYSDIRTLSYQKKMTREISRVEAVSRNNIFDLFKNIFTCDLLVLGGGTLLQTATSNRSLWYYLSFAYLAKFLKKEVAMLGNGFGPIHGETQRKLTRSILNKMELIMLRDQGSKVYMEKMGVASDFIHVTTDFVYDFKGGEKCAEKVNKVAVNVRQWKDADKMYRELALYLDHLRQQGQEIEFILFEKNDFIAARQVQSLMSEKASIIPYTENYHEVIRSLAHYDYLIAMRLHGMIFSSLSGVPFLGISYDPKINYLCDQMRYPYVINVENFTADGAKVMMHDMCLDEAGRKCEAYVHEQSVKMQESVELMKTFLREA